ncbi:MAG: cation:proton antiporter [Prevotella sp.]|nr:cation:proton antiporter [Prevotella sp.]
MPLVQDPTMIFFVVLLIILFAPIIMGKLRIPHIIGMVLAGIVIGQHGFNILARDRSFEIFGSVGLLYIMFLAGLEINLSDLKKYGVRMSVFGLLTFFVPFAMGYFVGVTLLGYSPTAAMLLACILSSNTLIAYPIVGKYGLQKHRSVVLSVGSSMIALSLALTVLAAFAASYKGEADLLFWLTFAGKVVLFCTVSILIIPRLTRWFFRRYNDAVMLYVYTMSVLFLSAAASDACGLEGIFGAFFAGLLLNRFIPGVSPLMNRLEFIGNALFIPYFLIGVGMLIDIRVMFHDLNTAWVVFCIVFFGTFGKAIAAYLSCLVFRLHISSGHMMFGLTTAHAAGSIAMVMVGMELLSADGTPLVDNMMLNGVVMMILFTCIISSVTTDSASRLILLREKLHKTEEAEHQGDDEKMLLPLQHAEDATNLVHLAILMRNKRLNRGIIGINVVYDDQYSNDNQQEGLKVLEAATRTADSADVRIQTQSRLATNIANGLKHAFKENRASEIIMGMHHRKSPGDSFWGAYTQGLITEINRQIMICRINRPLNTIRRIVVAIPSRVEYESGFYRWIERLSRMAENLNCRIVFHGRMECLKLIRGYIEHYHAELRAEYEHMEHWKEFPTLSTQVHDDHLLIVITARMGTVSYKATFEYLPRELSQYFPSCSLIILYPDQNGQPQDAMTFTAPQQQTDESAYVQLLNWLRRKPHKTH